MFSIMDPMCKALHLACFIALSASSSVSLLCIVFLQFWLDGLLCNCNPASPSFCLQSPAPQASFLQDSDKLIHYPINAPPAAVSRHASYGGATPSLPGSGSSWLRASQTFKTAIQWLWTGIGKALTLYVLSFLLFVRVRFFLCVLHVMRNRYAGVYVHVLYMYIIYIRLMPKYEYALGTRRHLIMARQTPLSCPGHTRPVVHLHYSNITENGFYFITASKGKR